VQLYAASLPIAIEAFDREQLSRAKRLETTNAKRNLAGLGPLPPAEPTAEELSWQGGPGFCVHLANFTLDELLADEQRQGFVYTAAVAGDGSWDPRKRRVSRAALLHDGTRLGGALATDDLIGGARDNYDAELAHRVDALAALAGKRVLYIFDSTSPILAGEHFRRSTLSVRSRALCDDWQGWAMAHEQRLDAITYWWSHSHCGHLPEAAVDALAKEYLRGDPVPLPPAHCRHRSVRHYAKGSERELMLQAHNLHVVRTLYTAPKALFASHGNFEFLRQAKLNDQMRCTVMALRDDRGQLLGSRSFGSTGPFSLGAVLDEMGCPCGKGRQTVAHVMWACELGGVVSRRRSLLAPACTALGKDLDRCEPVSRDHAVSTIVRRALEHGRLPAAYSTFTGATLTSLSTPEAATAALAHVLGIVREPTNWFRPTSALARPLLIASLSMVAAAIKASASTLRAAVCVSRRRTLLHRALDWLRYSTWTCPKPAGLPCRCCAVPGSPRPGVHIRRSRRPIDGIEAALAVRTREGLRANGPAHVSSLRAHTFRIRDEADRASSTAYRASFELLQTSLQDDDAATAASVLVDDAVVLAEALELVDLPSTDARADIDRAIAAHRAAVIAAANTATRHTAALDHSHACNARAHLVSRFACWAAQTISGLVIEGQRAAVRAHVALKAAAAARAAAPPPISPEERCALTTRRAARRRERGAAGAAIQCALREREHVHAMRLLASRPDAAAAVARVCAAARARRAAVASMDPMQRAARHALRLAGTTALQDLLAEVAGRRREAHDTAARLRDFARARRAAVLAARMLGGVRTVHVRRVTLLLAGETAPRRARVRAAAAAAAANSGPIGTIGLR
jgi:hypothetical protein